MRLVPALMEGDLAQIDAGIEAIQLSTFKRSISAAQPDSVRLARKALLESGVTAGLSSMGSTMYTITSELDAGRVALAYRDVFKILDIDGTVHTTQIARTGANIQ